MHLRQFLFLGLVILSGVSPWLNGNVTSSTVTLQSSQTTVRETQVHTDFGPVTLDLTAKSQAVPGENVTVRINMVATSQNTTGPLNVTIGYKNKSLTQYLDKTIRLPFSHDMTFNAPTVEFPVWVFADVSLFYGNRSSHGRYDLVDVVPVLYEKLQSQHIADQLQISSLQANMTELSASTSSMNSKIGDLEIGRKNATNYYFLFMGTTIVAASILAVVLVRRRRGQTRGVMPSPEVGAQLWYRMGFLSDTGKVRKNNEDSVLALETLCTFESVDRARILCAVADGVGGSQKGEIASKLALQTIATLASERMLQGDGVDIRGALKSAIEGANGAVVKYALEHPESEGMATTIVATLIDGDIAHIAHAGDSRAYLFSQREKKLLTKDHSEYPGSNVITRAIGAATDLQVDLSRLTISPGETLLLCTDGLWGLVSNEEIHQVVLEAKDPQEGCNRLVSMANERGGKDNISVIMVQCQGLSKMTAD